MRSIDLVREFHETFDQPVRTTPCVDDEGTNYLRVRLIYEELRELAEALGFSMPRVEDAIQGNGFPSCTRGFDLDRAVAVLDALTDIQYTLDGTVVSLGFTDYIDDAMIEVHRSNMSKRWADGSIRKHPDGKVHKPPTYSPADLRKVLLK